MHRVFELVINTKYKKELSYAVTVSSSGVLEMITLRTPRSYA